MEAIIVLGCRVGPAGQLSGAAARRVARAARAYHEGLAPRLILSGGRRWHGVPEAEAYRRALIALGVPDSALVRELCSLTTRENAHYSARLLARKPVSDLGVVTCDFHLPRALRCFRAEGLRPTGLPAITPTYRASHWAQTPLEGLGQLRLRLGQTLLSWQ